MKIAMMVLYGVGFCAATATGVWLAQDAPADEVVQAVQAAPDSSARATSPSQASQLWAWGNVRTTTTDEKWDVLLARALQPSNAYAEGGETRDKLRELASKDPAVMQQLMQAYDKQANPQARQLIVALLSNVEKPEVLDFSRKLALSSDVTQRKDGLAMLQNLSGDVPGVRPVILQTLSRDKSPDVVLMALAALKPPADGDDNASGATAAADSAAIVAQLQDLTRNADPNIRLQSIVQLAQWDRTDSSQEYWVQALADQVPQVRQTAVTAIAQSGIQSDPVKAALISLANNHNESRDVRGSALQVLESFPLSKDEALNFSQLRSEVLGL